MNEPTPLEEPEGSAGADAEGRGKIISIDEGSIKEHLGKWCSKLWRKAESRSCGTSKSGKTPFEFVFGERYSKSAGT
jgi:hypothetical protein